MAAEYWGSSMNSTTQDLVRAAIDLSNIYYGTDMDKNAQYIKSKMIPGNWSVYIWKGQYNASWTIYECRHLEFWGYLSDYGILGWSYYIVYSY